MKNIKKS